MIFNISETEIGGGGDGWTEKYTIDVPIATSSTSIANLNISVPKGTAKKNKIYYVRIRDNAGPRNGYFYGTDALLVAKNDNPQFVMAQTGYRYDENGEQIRYSPTSSASPSGYGVYVYSLSASSTANSDSLLIRHRYNASYSGTVDGTFNIKIFEADFPTGYPSGLDEE